MKRGLLILLAALALTACGGGDPEPEPNCPPEREHIPERPPIPAPQRL